MAQPVSTKAAEPLFAARGVSVRFGGVQALSQVSLEVAPHEVLGVIGPNGAGKTTLFNVLCGFAVPDEGELAWEGRPLGRVRPSQLAGLGMARTLQGLGLFDRMTVLENVMVGADHHARAGFWTGLFGLGHRDEARLVERSRAVLARLGVEDYAERMPGGLPYGVRKKVALARALVSEPRLLLLDEPASGLSPHEMEELGGVVRDLTATTATLLVEHHMDLVMSVCDHVTVLDFGRVIASGTPAQVQDDPAVTAAYLGTPVADGEVS
ncbi:branched-chain amino acid transport system ATP-binding protein [Nocardioides terrae]|uniref:Branched-chain amino acid transport system ATP-binding protein n=1 Tax=Nocardioides terrae TaxID=574651 RepID=A0A1I1LGS5_9ACTN|nr:ABC transporter ATP-binding protein [Nocardioides terrae]SFC72239.1 branched-chain amino acid transport system ATP-binding protein [Nocardioides terrae]